MARVFISYSSLDKPFARRLEASLRLAGVDVWLDEKKLLVGDSIIKELGNAIDESDFVVAVLSNNSVRSVWVEKELALAMTHEQERKAKVVLPIKIDNCVVPTFLRDKLYADFSEDVNFDDALYALLAVVSTDEAVCSYCSNEVPLSLGNCPHCAYPTAPPNVRSARLKVEQVALRERYISALEFARANKCEDLIKEFEHSMLGSRVVVNTSIRKLQRLASSPRELFSGYYLETEAGSLRLPLDSWDRQRRIAEEVLFPGYKEQIRYGVLSLEANGLDRYGECSLALREDMIEHRTSFLESNSMLFAQRHAYKLPEGSKATWQDRGKLCVAKLAQRLALERPSAGRFASLVLREGASPTEDEFIEAHIWGPISIRTVESVNVSSRCAEAEPLREWEQVLSQYNVAINLF
jgi:hypothetical protein